ncbi:hypothetical protein LCGC14_2107840 [marine sediment metagenome]|uniref:Uncharacterized protein n=1 Tax=marine sediment metagenome TaxID=412755 RepID=A0A0F9H496_9ZZZZ
MAVWIGIDDIKSDVLYGLLIGRAFKNRATLEVRKTWDLHFYPTEKGRKRGMIYQKRQYGGDLMTFEIKVIDLFKQAELAVVIPREINVNEAAMQYLKK